MKTSEHTPTTAVTSRKYRIAVATESGEWDIIAEFDADDDAEANKIAADEYDAYDWYVLDSHGENING